MCAVLRPSALFVLVRGLHVALAVVLVCFAAGPASAQDLFGLEDEPEEPSEDEVGGTEARGTDEPQEREGPSSEASAPSPERPATAPNLRVSNSPLANEPPDGLNIVVPGSEETSEDVVERLGEAIGEFGSSLGQDASHGRLRWDPAWPRYRFDELVVTLGMGLVIGLEEVLPTRGDPNWSGVSDFDLEVASAFGLTDPFARDVLDEVSSGLGVALFLWPVAFDALLFAGIGEGAWDVGWQMSLISLEVFTINHAIGVLVRLLARRERPLGRFCREQPGYDIDPICRAQPPAESFWSSHVSNAFAGAALICLQHDVVDLYGDEVADAMACGSALALAATTGVFRLMSNQNWVTDVLTGAVVGSLTGLIVPWLLHFQGGARPPLRGTEAPTITFMPMMNEDVIGMTSSGTF